MDQRQLIAYLIIAFVIVTAAALLVRAKRRGKRGRKSPERIDLL